MKPVADTPFVELRRPVHSAELAADRCLERCCQMLGLAEPPLPVPIDLWIEHPVGVDFAIEDPLLDDDGTPLDGVAFLRENRIRIAAGITDDECRYRWVCAHELGHIEMHEPSRVDGSLAGEDLAVPYGRGHPREKQADRFASAFLLPARLIVRELAVTAEAARIDPTVALPELITESSLAVDLWRELFVPRLAHRFRVSANAVLHRMADLRLADDRPLMLTSVLARVLAA